MLPREEADGDALDVEALKGVGEGREVRHGEVCFEGGAVVVDLVEDDVVGGVFAGADVELMAARFVGQGMFAVVTADVEELFAVLCGCFKFCDDDESQRAHGHARPARGAQE